MGAGTMRQSGSLTVVGGIPTQCVSAGPEVGIPGEEHDVVAGTA
jgi:hypothetical protein